MHTYMLGHIMRTTLFVILSATILCGCFSTLPSTNKAKWYAVVANGGPEQILPASRVPGTVCIMIVTKYWGSIVNEPMIPTPQEELLYSANVNGDGPLYRDVAINDGTGPPLPNLGAITIDKKNNKVIIDMQRVVSKPGELLKTEPSPANGTYQIKRWME